MVGRAAQAKRSPTGGLEAAAGALPATATVAIALLAGLFALHHLYDFDLLWHLKTGAWIDASGAVPRTDPFGGGTAGIPWLDVAWGAQAILAALAAHGGVAAVQLAAVAFVTATLLALLGRAPRTPIVLAAALFVVLSASHRFLPRPDLLALALVPAALALVEALPSGRRSTPLLLALLSAAWANLHGSFVLAPILVLAAGAGATPTLGVRRAARRYGPPLLLAALAPMVNPRGAHLYTVLSPYVASMRAAVGLAPAGAALAASEWTPTTTALLHDAIFPSAAFLLLILVVALSFLRRGRAASLPRLAAGLAMLALALTAVRNLLPFAAAALAIVVANERDRLAPADRAADAGDDPFDAAWFRLLAAVLALVVTLSYGSAVLSDRYYVARQLPITTGIGFDPALVPEGAAEWLATHDAPGLLFNNYNSGSYLLWRLAPAVPVYIDARFDTTPVNRAIEATLADPASLPAFLDRERIGTVVLQHPSPETVAFLPRLTPENGWTLAWRDANTTIHLRNGTTAPLRATPLALPPMNGRTAERLDAFLARFKGPVLPAAELTDAFVSEILGDTPRAAEAYRRALARAPDDPRAIDGATRTGRR